MQEINLYDLLRYYARNWLNLLSALLVGAIIGLVYTAFIQTPLYKSEATMLVVGARTSATDTTLNNNYTELFKSRLVLGTTTDQLGYGGDYNQLLARTTATNDKNTDVLKVSVVDSDAKKSQRLLRTAVETFKAQAGKIYGSNNIKTVDVATLPSAPYNVNLVTQVGLSMVAVFALVTIVLFFMYDYSLSSRQGLGSSGSRPKVAAKATSKKKVSKKGKQPIGAQVSLLMGRLVTLFTVEDKKPIKKSR